MPGTYGYIIQFKIQAKTKMTESVGGRLPAPAWGKHLVSGGTAVTPQELLPTPLHMSPPNLSPGPQSVLHCPRYLHSSFSPYTIPITVLQCPSLSTYRNKDLGLRKTHFSPWQDTYLGRPTSLIHPCSFMPSWLCCWFRLPVCYLLQ